MSQPTEGLLAGFLQQATAPTVSLPRDVRSIALSLASIDSSLKQLVDLLQEAKQEAHRG